MPIIQLPTVVQSNCFCCLDTELQGTTVTITVYYTGGGLQLWLGLSADPNTTPTDWEEVTSIVSGTARTYTITGTGKALYYSILKDYDTIIAAQHDTYGRKTAPAITIGGLL